jgi:predicted nucleic acid-binding protein
MIPMSDLRGKVLVDTNVWIDFLRQPEPELRELIKRDRVLTCRCVIGEVMVGSLRDRSGIREFFMQLPNATEATFSEVLNMLESRRLFGCGLQWNDVILLAAAKLSAVRLWTRDKRLAAAAEEFGIGWTEGGVL